MCLQWTNEPAGNELGWYGWSVCLSVCLSVCVHIYSSLPAGNELGWYGRSVRLSVYLSVSLSVYLSLYLCLCVSTVDWWTSRQWTGLVWVVTAAVLVCTMEVAVIHWNLLTKSFVWTRLVIFTRTTQAVVDAGPTVLDRRRRTETTADKDSTHSLTDAGHGLSCNFVAA